MTESYLVIDAHEDVRRILNKDREWMAPRPWRAEFQNVLVRLLRSGVLDLDRANAFLDVARDLMDGGEYDVPGDEVLALALESGCSACDCEFVPLARDLSVTLVTADRRSSRPFRIGPPRPRGASSPVSG